MTFDEYWKALTDKNPKLKEEEVVKVKQTGLYNMLKQAYDKGWEHSKLVSDKLNQTFNNYQKEANTNTNYSDFFDQIFKGKK